MSLAAVNQCPRSHSASTTKKGKRKTGRCLIPDQENLLFLKWLQSEIKKNGAITEVAK